MAIPGSPTWPAARWFLEPRFFIRKYSAAAAISAPITAAPIAIPATAPSDRWPPDCFCWLLAVNVGVVDEVEVADELSDVLLMVVVGTTELEALLERDDTELMAADEMVVDEVGGWLLLGCIVVEEELGTPG